MVGTIVSLSLVMSLSPLALISQSLARAEPSAEPPPLARVDASLVLVPAHVRTLLGGPVMDLGKQDFRVFEDGVEQTIVHFASDDSPLSIGVLFDCSGSMGNKMRKSSEAAAAFFKTANREDEFFLVKFNSRARLAVPFTPDPDLLYDSIVRTQPFGQTSLLDALHLALGQMKKARNQQKAIVIFSDGGDNWSRHTVRQVTNALAESDVLVYAMGIFDADYSIKHPAEERRGPQLLEKLAEQTGGREVPVSRLDDLPAISAAIGRELRNRYLLGYYSTNALRDGKYRKVRLELNLAKPTAELRTSFRRGYYAPPQ